MSKRYFLTTVLAASFGNLLIGCNMSNASQQANSSVSELGKFINLPSWVKSCDWELVTLPEQSSTSIPGPTDYVALVALIRSVSNAPGERVSGLKESPGKTAPVMRAFVRSWLPTSATAALSGLGKNAVATYAVEGWARRPVKRAIAVDTPDGLVLYLEYVAP